MVAVSSASFKNKNNKKKLFQASIMINIGHPKHALFSKMPAKTRLLGQVWNNLLLADEFKIDFWLL